MDLIDSIKPAIAFAACMTLGGSQIHQFAYVIHAANTLFNQHYLQPAHKADLPTVETSYQRKRLQ